MGPQRVGYDWVTFTFTIMLQTRPTHPENRQNHYLQTVPFPLSFLVSHLILMSQARTLTVNTVLSKNSFLWKSYQSTNAFCAYIAFHRKPNKEHMMELQNSTYSAAWVCRKMTFIVYTALGSFPSSHLLTRERNNSKYTPRLKCSPIHLEMMKVRQRKTNTVRQHMYVETKKVTPSYIQIDSQT